MPSLTEQLAGAAALAQPMAQPDVSEIANLAAAYSIQRDLVGARPGGITGLKLGFTSRAKMVQMGVSDLICGQLTEDMYVPDGGTLSTRLIHPRAEPEIAFVLNGALKPGSPAELLRSVEAVAVAIEVIDSRYRDFKFSLEAVVADNASSAAYCIGPPASKNTDLSNLGLILRLDGHIAAMGSSAAILGHPLRALAEAARLAEHHEIEIGSGSVVLAGAATAAAALGAAHHVSVEAQGLGRAGFAVAPCR